MNPSVFLLLNLALAFYNAGTIWAMEIDIFRSWRIVGADFHRVQEAHWRKLPFWIFAPVSLALAGSIALFWGRLQAKLSQDPLGAQSPYLRQILRTHWLRTLLINASAFILLAWTIRVVRP